MLRLLLIFAVVCIAASVGLAADESPFNVDCFCGWGGYYRPMEWTPVEIGISSTLTKPFEGAVNVTTQQDGLNTMNITHGFVLTPDIPLRLPLVTKIAFAADKCRVRLTDGRGRTRWYHEFELWNFAQRNRYLTVVSEMDLLVGLIGSRKFGMVRLPKESVCTTKGNQGKVYVADKLPRSVPWDWTGFASLDLLILSNPDWSAFNRHQLGAIAQWVSNGGKLLLILGSRPMPADNPLVDLLPFEIQQEKQTTVSSETLETLRLDSSRVEPVVCRPLKPKPGANACTAELLNNSECVFATGYAGFGSVAVLGFDPSDLSDRQMKHSSRFWVGLIEALLEGPPSEGGALTGETHPDRNDGGSERSYANRGIKFVEDAEAHLGSRGNENNYNPGLAQAGSNAVMEYLYDIPEMRPLSIWWVIGLLTALAILLGPVDYKVLKRKDRLPLTWLTCAAWIAIFTAGAYYGVQELRGGKMQLRAVSVIDGIAHSQSVWSTRYMGLFAPRSADYRLDGYESDQWWNDQWFSAMAPSEESIYAYRREPARRNIYCVQQDGYNRPYSIPINIWTIQCLINESPQEKLPLQATVSRDGERIVLNITNDCNSPIKSGYVLFAGGRSLKFNDVAAGETRQFTGDLTRDDFWSGQLDRLRREERFQQFRGRFQNEKALFARGCLQRTNAIRAYLDQGAAVVHAVYDNAAVPFTVEKRSCDYQHIQLVRQVVFPDELDSTGPEEQ